MARVIFMGIKELQAAMTRIQARQMTATRVALKDSLSLIERTTKDMLSIGTHRPGEPTMSMPGEPPELVTGDLRRSVKQSPIEQGFSGKFSGEVGPTIEYGRIQELGGVAGHGSILPSRPYLQPAFEESLPEIGMIFRNAWASALAA